MAKLRLTMACWDYDRTRAVMDGRVPVDGVELNYLNLPVEEIFFRMLRHREFDVAELSLSSYAVSLFDALPICECGQRDSGAQGFDWEEDWESGVSDDGSGVDSRDYER